jgi:dipeptidyl aminopeptidase/acylaminoacyl peptidase
VITDAPSPRGGAWGPDDRIVFSGAFRVGLEVVPASGGASAVLTELDVERREKSHRWPVFLPDGEHILFVAQTGEAGAKDDASTIEALSLATGERTPLVTANSSPLYAPPGFLLFWREGALRAQAFDAGRLSVSGSVFTVANDVAFDENELAMASMSADGTLVFQTGVGASQSDLVVVDRAGQTVRTVAESVLSEGGLALSPEGSRLAVSITAPGARDQDVWIYDLVRGTSAPLTFEEGAESFPTWSPDGASLFYINNRVDDGIVFRRRADGGGGPEQVAVNPTGAGFFVRTVSSDGRWLLNATPTDATSFDLVRYDLDTGEITPLVSTAFDELIGAVSPDDRWLAYTSDQTGRSEVYVRSLGDEAGLWQVSLEGGSFPSWRADGRELYFLTPQSRLMAVDIDAGETFRPSTPRELFAALFDVDLTRGHMSYAPFPDGQRFVVDVLKERRTALLTLVTNWLAPSAAAR